MNTPNKPKRLIIVDGIPGSGKTTTATRIREKLLARGIRTRCLLEQEADHPLLLPNVQYESLSTAEGADAFIGNLLERYREFVRDQLNGPDEVIIIESVMLQDTVSVSHLQGMETEKLRGFSAALMRTLEPLNPALVYYYHLDVEGQWRFICGVRGNEWGPVSFKSDDDFVQAGEVWDRAQSFVRTIVDVWDIPKLIIENKEYLWDEYAQRIDEFLESALLGDTAGT